MYSITMVVSLYFDTNYKAMDYGPDLENIHVMYSTSQMSNIAPFILIWNWICLDMVDVMTWHTKINVQNSHPAFFEAYTPYYGNM